MRFTTNTALNLLVATLLALGTPAPSASEESNAIATVDSLHAALLDIMQNAESLGYAGRRDRIGPVIEGGFDLPFITRIALGKYWKDLSPEQRDEMMDVFSRWTIANYASRFSSYSGERFNTLSTEKARKGREFVRTVLDKASDSTKSVSLDYLLHETDGKWRIVNVVANGVSDLSLKRADYGTVMKSQGLDSLIEKLNAQIGELESAN